MSISRRAKWMILLTVLSVGTAFQAGTGCTEFFYSSAISSFDFCSVLNCTGGSFFNFCDPVPLLVDCPNYVQTTTP